MTAINHQKFANTVLYLLEGCRKLCGDRPGLTKLMKLLYFSDFEHYRVHLKPITGLKYVALERGPAPQNYKSLLDPLVDGGSVVKTTVPIYGLSKPKSEYTANTRPNLNLFSESEIEILDRVINEHGRDHGAALSDRAHREGPWTYTWDSDHPGMPVPYGLVRWLDNMCDEGDRADANAALHRPGVLEIVQKLDPNYT